MATEALKKLHTAMLDTRGGYEVARKDAETRALDTLFSEMVALRTKDHEAIHQALASMGDKPDESGSFMGTIHKTVTNVRSAVTGIDAKALSPFISGEVSIIENYDAAIDEASSDPDVRDILTEQRAALLSKIAEMKALKAA